MVIELDRVKARRLAVQAQWLDARRPPDLVHLVEQLTFVQLEPTAPIAPTADLVLWSRMHDHYASDDLTTALEDDFSLFELALLARPMADLPLFLADMRDWPTTERARRWLDDNEEFRRDILDRLDGDGPLLAKDIADTSIVSWSSSGWNSNRNVMMMLECLMMRGEIAVAGRRGRNRLWDLAERVYHSDLVAVPSDEATLTRAARRLRSQGVVSNTGPDLPTETIRVGDAGIPVTIEGQPGVWRADPDLLDTEFTGRTALLSPFDGLIRDRKRMERLFEFEYALEMYKPAARRRWGYYALPILHHDRLVGKVDAAVTEGALVVAAIHEDETFTAAIREDVNAELASLASWLRVDLRA